MSEAAMVAMPSPALVNLDEAARYLGVSRRHVERLVAAGILPRVRLGRAVRIAIQDLDSYVDLLRSETQ